MLRYYGIVRDAASVVEGAAIGALESLRDGRVEQEPQFTDRMLGRVEQSMEGYENKGVLWRAKTLTDRGRNSQERRYGADFLGVANIDLPGLSVSKGFLAQAKLIEPGAYISPSDYERMQKQCDDMLRLSPDSFVFLYSASGIRVVPAITIASCEKINPHDLYSRSIGRFFEEHFSCFIGDRAISTPNIEALEAIARDYQARSALALSATALE
jgi:hypothetical protein